MRSLIYATLLLLISTLSFSQSPHGKDFKLDCAQCHNENSWTVKREKIKFNHNKTKFPLLGQHQSIDCRKCHSDLDFAKAKTKTNCSSCHADVHQQTVGRDCERCHTTNSWLVTNVKQIHQQSGFALVGAHASVDCNSCHKSASQQRYDKMDADCYSCHKAKYDATTKPNHRELGFSTDCFRCHNMVGRDWTVSGKGFEHGFLPLVGAHALECSNCHGDLTYKENPSPDCKGCHSYQYEQALTIIPAHTTKIAKFDCNDCHSPSTWNSVRFKQHDGWFGIYSGNHKGEWSKCTDCHNNDATYKANCKKCHD